MTRSIMVIDNDAHILALLDEILTQAGHEVHLYSHGLPDRDELLRVRPALLICDYLVEDDQLGQELWGILSRETELATTPLLLCTTAAPQLAAHAGWWNAPGIHIIAKPFDVDGFLCVVQQALAPAGAGTPATLRGSMAALTPPILHIFPDYGFPAPLVSNPPGR